MPGMPTTRKIARLPLGELVTHDSPRRRAPVTGDSPRPCRHTPRTPGDRRKSCMIFRCTPAAHTCYTASRDIQRRLQMPPGIQPPQTRLLRPRDVDRSTTLRASAYRVQTVPSARSECTACTCRTRSSERGGGQGNHLDPLLSPRRQRDFASPSPGGAGGGGRQSPTTASQIPQPAGGTTAAGPHTRPAGLLPRCPTPLRTRRRATTVTTVTLATRRRLAGDNTVDLNDRKEALPFEIGFQK